MTVSTLKRPSALVPVAMSLAALGVVAVRIAVSGTGREPDEGTAAHLWQLLMAGQIPVIAYFAISWLPRAPRQALAVLALQAAAGLAAAAPVFLLGL
jgi:preprotein translocase subunit SecY